MTCMSKENKGITLYGFYYYFSIIYEKSIYDHENNFPKIYSCQFIHRTRGGVWVVIAISSYVRFWSGKFSFLTENCQKKSGNFENDLMWEPCYYPKKHHTKYKVNTT